MKDTLLITDLLKVVNEASLDLEVYNILKNTKKKKTKKSPK